MTSFSNTIHKDEVSYLQQFKSSQAKIQNYSYSLKICLRQMLGCLTSNDAPDINSKPKMIYGARWGPEFSGVYKPH